MPKTQPENLPLQEAETILANATDSSASPTAIAIAASRIVARLASGNIKGCTVAEIMTLLAALPIVSITSGLADHAYIGPTKTITAGENLVITDVCYLKSDGKYWKIDANDEAKAKGPLVLSTGTIAADATGTALLPSSMSYLRDDSGWGGAMTVGAPMFLSNTATGGLRDAPTYGDGDILRIGGHAEAARIIQFDPESRWDTISV